MRCLFVAAALVLCGSRLAGAQGSVEAARAEARRSLQDGAKRFEEGDYAGALARFEEAYRHFPSPRFFYNMGQAQRQLARDVEALESFERFLKESPDAPATARDAAQNSVLELQAQIGTLEVSANVAGAEVAIDGRSFGLTPRGPIRVAPGPHQIVVEKAGYEPFLERFQVAPGVRLPVRAQLALRPPPAVRTKVASAPPPDLRASRGHRGQPGIFARADIAPTLPGFVLAPGLSYGLHDRVELQAAALIGHHKGAWAGGRFFLMDGPLKPSLTTGVPFFFTQGASGWGVQGSAGLQWDPARAFGLFVELGAAFYPFASNALGPSWLLSSVGLQGRY